MLARLIGPHLPEPANRPFWLLGIDVTPVPRPFAQTLADRTFIYQPNAVKGVKPVNIGHLASVVACLPEKGEQDAPWLLPLRRLTWLRTMTWFARWQAAWQGGDHPASRDATMTRHIGAHIAASFEADAIAEARADWLKPDLAQVLN